MLYNIRYYAIGAQNRIIGVDTINKTALTIAFNHVKPQETIGELIKKTHLQGQRFQVSITVEEPEKPVTSFHPLADYWETD